MDKATRLVIHRIGVILVLTCSVISVVLLFTNGPPKWYEEEKPNSYENYSEEIIDSINRRIEIYIEQHEQEQHEQEQHEH